MTTAAGQASAIVTYTSAETIGAATSSFIGAAIVLVIAAILVALGSSDSESSEAEQQQELSEEIAELEQIDLKTYWNGTLAPIMLHWSPLETDLNNIASEGIGSNTAPVVKNPDVQNSVNHR